MPPKPRGGKGANAPTRPQDFIALGKGNAPNAQATQRRAVSVPITPVGNKQISSVLNDVDDVEKCVLEWESKNEFEKKTAILEATLDFLLQKTNPVNTEKYDIILEHDSQCTDIITRV
jgi:hypothetical protein